MERQYLCIDFKSFFASVECVERGLDPMKADLVVADPDRQQTTICLAVSPALRAKGVKNRCRLYEIPKELSYIQAPPRMQLYIDYSANIYAIYLKYVAKEDIHVYSIDEAFLDVTKYLPMYRLTARQLGEKICKEVLDTYGITAACGIGTNLFLAKVALDITAKNSPIFIGELNEESYRDTLWDHTPITDFWRFGAGTARRLNESMMFTMRDIANCPPKILYKLFGVDAEIMIDHAWGREPTTIADIKAYKAQTHSLSSGQVLPRNYSFDQALLIVKEMIEQLCLELSSQNLLASSVTVFVGYANGTLPPSGVTAKFTAATNSLKSIVEYGVSAFHRVASKNTPIRRINISFNNTVPEVGMQYHLFSDPKQQEAERAQLKTINTIKKRYGKNSIFRGVDLKEGATARERNRQIGGHKSGEN